MLVIDDHLLDALEAVDKYVIDVLEELSNPLSAVLGGEEPPNLLDGPLAYLRGSQRITCSEQNGGERRRFLTHAPIQGHNLERFSEC